MTLTQTFLFGFPVRLTLNIDGEDVDVSSAIRISSDAPYVTIDPSAVLHRVDVEREVRARLASR